MVVRRLRTGIAAVVGVAAVAIVTTAFTSAGALAQTGGGGGSGGIPQLTSFTPKYAALPSTSTSRIAAAATASVTNWSHAETDGTSHFTYRMVGKDPTVHEAVPSTTIRTEIIPVIIRYSNGHVWDPTIGDTCDSTSALTRTVNSPIVKSAAYTLGGTPVGTGQYVDIFQRANYFSFTKPTGINPGYHVKLGVTVLSAVTINVPNADAAEGTATCGTAANAHKFAAVDINFLRAQLVGTVIPSLASHGVGVTTFPLFLFGNVVEYIGTTSNCCVLGFHSVQQTTAGRQTFGIAMYDNTGVFNGSRDVSVLSHEVAEWLADPFVNNPTKPWGHIGQVSGCQNNLEVGDPLSGTTSIVTMNGKGYHLQDEAFTSWFYHESPSTGVNGWYSLFGTFRSAAAACH